MNYSEEYIDKMEKMIVSRDSELRREKARSKELAERLAAAESENAALRKRVGELELAADNLRESLYAAFDKLIIHDLAAFAPAADNDEPEKADPSKQFMKVNADTQKPGAPHYEQFIFDNESGRTTLMKYIGKLGNVVIPKEVRIIAEGAFSGCGSLTNVTIPDGVESIGDGAFYGCTSLTSVTIPASVTSIGRYAFSGCDNLMIICNEGSCAERYCRENRLRYTTTA